MEHANKGNADDISCVENHLTQRENMGMNCTFQTAFHRSSGAWQGYSSGAGHSIIKSVD